MKTRKVNPIIHAVNESIRDSRTNAQRMQQRAKDLESQRMLIRVKFSDMLKGFNTDKHYVGVGLVGTKPQISITLNRLDSFKDQDLTSLLEFLLNKNASIKEEAWPQFHNKDYHAEMDDALVSIHAYIRSDSETCRRIQVGTEMQEVPVYQLQCD